MYAESVAAVSTCRGAGGHSMNPECCGTPAKAWRVAAERRMTTWSELKMATVRSPGPCHRSGCWSPASEPSSDYVGFMDLWGRVSPSSSVSPANSHSIDCSTLIIRDWWPMYRVDSVAPYPKGGGKVRSSGRVGEVWFAEVEYVLYLYTYRPLFCLDF
jgi:hypothetical protein